MRTSTLVLSLTTATFAMSTGWLAWKLYERDWATPAATPASPHSSLASADGIGTNGIDDIGSSGISTASELPARAPKNVPGVNGLTTETPTAPTSGPPGNARHIDTGDPAVAFARQFVARLDDSVQRQSLLDEQRTAVRRQYARLKEQLGLSDARFEQLVTSLAEYNLQAQELWTRCAVDPSCDPKDDSRMRPDDRTQELLALLGADAYDDFSVFRETLQEHDAVALLRGRLARTRPKLNPSS